MSLKNAASSQRGSSKISLSSDAASPSLDARHAPRIEIEATGGITLDTVRAYAEAGADYVSIGALTHSVQAVDLTLEM